MKTDCVCLNVQQITEYKGIEMKEFSKSQLVKSHSLGHTADNGEEQHHLPPRKIHHLNWSHHFQISPIKAISTDTKFLLLSSLW